MGDVTFYDLKVIVFVIVFAVVAAICHVFFRARMTRNDGDGGPSAGGDGGGGD